jgi:hypothetical protein
MDDSEIPVDLEGLPEGSPDGLIVGLEEGESPETGTETTEGAEETPPTE